VKITIAERLKPFSHTPGAACLIPGTTWKIEAFPTLIRIGEKYDVPLPITGPVADFTLELDLEKNHVFVFGKAKKGYFRLKIQAVTGGIEVVATKGFLLDGKRSLFFKDDVDFFLPKIWERLSLGLSRSQDWDLVKRRGDLKEILPVIFVLGQKIPYIEPVLLRGTGRLLEAGNFDSFWRGAFSGILIPRWIDGEHQGLAPVESVSGDPCFLIREAAIRIRRLFLRQEGNQVSLLPACTFDAGRMTKLQVNGFGELDLEWASHRLRRTILRASSSGEILFDLPKGLKSFRMKTTASQRGARLQGGEPLHLEAGKTYFLDQFHF
jgi:hypothetical protein